MTIKKYNLNDKMTVQLTAAGVIQFYKYCEKEQFHVTKIMLTDSGELSLSGWEIMAIFGDLMGVGKVEPIMMNVKVCVEDEAVVSGNDIASLHGLPTQNKERFLKP